LSADSIDYDELQRAQDVVRQLWEAGVLICLTGGPMRYTEIATWLGQWSRVRPSDSAVTRSTGRLVRAGYVERVADDGGPPKQYQLTRAGRERADLLARLAALFEEDAE